MDEQTRKSFEAHITKLTKIALTCEDADRRSDAALSLFCMALLRAKEDNPHYAGSMAPLIERAVLMVGEPTCGNA